MDGYYIVAIIFGALILLVLDYFIAKEFYQIAVEKGYEDKRYFWYSFLMPVSGYAMVIALPDHSNNIVEAVVSDELPEL